MVRSMLLAVLFTGCLAGGGLARDDGRYSGLNPQIREWFENLSSKKGLCCSFADGISIKDVDWDTGELCGIGKASLSPDCSLHYRVRLDGQWIWVPTDAVIEEPNRYGTSVVWPYLDPDGTTKIRCFLPGTMG
jgi:hypothetical protein